MTAIHQIDLSQPPAAIDTGAERCMLILRWRGRVVGRTVTSVAGGRLSATAVQAAIARGVTVDALSHWLHDELGHDERALLGASIPSATVALCTRERPHDLDRALTAIAAQHHRPLEVIVVDNAPISDGTRQVVARHDGVRYLREDQRGLDAARNRALLEARGDVIAFTDDDAAPEPEWLGALLANFADRSTVVATGLTLPMVLETEAQELFEQHCTFVRGFRRRVFDGQRDNPLAVGPVGAGANMALRRDVVRSLGGFDERLDGGMPTRSGGDHDLFARVLIAGHRIVYDPAAVSWHRHRETREELLDTVYGYGVGVYAMWTGFLLERRELGVVRLAWQWFTQSQLKALLRPSHPFARTIAWHELRGCMHGPRSWFAARRLRATEMST
jgi:glycosyltransferase involved in cell wall biosynthesis